MRSTDRVRARLLDTNRRNPHYDLRNRDDFDIKPYNPEAIVIFENGAYLDKPRVVGESDNL